MDVDRECVCFVHQFWAPGIILQKEISLVHSPQQYTPGPLTSVSPDPAETAQALDTPLEKGIMFYLFALFNNHIYKVLYKYEI